MSGKLSEHSPNQGTEPQNNGNSQMNNLVVASSGAGAGAEPSRIGAMDHDTLKLRQYMQISVFNVLQQRQPSQGDAASKAKYMDAARRLEEGLFKIANTKEEYANKSTLESRIASLIKNRQLNNNYNQRHANSSTVGTMIPTTTGLLHAGGNPSSMVTSSSACASVGLRPSSNTVVPSDHDILKVREFMRTLVFNEIHKRQPCASKAKYLEVARHLEEGLFQMASTREDYLNLSTLASRLGTLIRGKILKNQQNANSSPPGTMTTLTPEVSPMVREKVPESEDELEKEIAESLKSMSLYS